MKRDNLIKAGFAAAVAVLISIALVSQGHISRWTELDRGESYTFTLMRKLDQLVYGLREVRRSQRAYLKSREPEQLSSYREARAGVLKNLAELDGMALEHPELRRWLTRIEPLVRGKLAQRELELETPPGAAPLKLPPEARISTDQINREIKAAQDEAIRQLREASARQLAEVVKVQRVLVAKAVVILVLMVLSFFLLRRDIARRRDRERELIEHRDELDRLVRRRTAELEGANRQLHDLHAHLDLVREEERLCIAREVHDGVGQSLTALQLDLSWLERRLPAAPSEAVERLRQMRQGLDDLIAQVQHITAELRPPLLDNLGLAAAIEWQAGEFSRRSGIECHLMLNEDIALASGPAATNLMRIFQEALTNIARHARCSEVCVSLCRRGEGILLEVSDNGCGISPEAAACPTAYGIMGMRERARLCHGELNICGQPGGGTTVSLLLPGDCEKRET